MKQSIKIQTDNGEYLIITKNLPIFFTQLFDSTYYYLHISGIKHEWRINSKVFNEICEWLEA